jgi:integrase
MSISKLLLLGRQPHGIDDTVSQPPGSHLAMKGAPARAIQELAGHADLSTTQRYMYLSPAATEDAIRLLDGRECVHEVETFGDSLDTQPSGGVKR